ncbi:response regulator transcription factor [Phormidium tenue FACHB-886]|nr:response regulator transcription factor [Phormidium tenue FACHB-886]
MLNCLLSFVNYLPLGVVFLNKPSNLQIGATLQITEETVKSHVNNILSKLNGNDGTQAVMVALKRGLVSLPERLEFNHYQSGKRSELTSFSDYSK